MSKPSAQQVKTTSKGFRKKLLFITLATLLLITGTIFTYLLVNGKGTLLGITTPTTQTQDPAKTPTTTNGTTTPIVDRTFKIPELGIQLTLPDGLEGLEYGVTTHDSRGIKSINITFTSKSLREAKDATKYCEANEAPVGEIVRFPIDPSRLEVNAFKENTIQFGQFYYVYFGPQQPCAQSDETAQMQTRQVELLQGAFRKAEIIK